MSFYMTVEKVEKMSLLFTQNVKSKGQKNYKLKICILFILCSIQRKNSTTKSVRSDTLVTELYVENADLMKQIANAESNHAKAEKQVRQLTDQKRALQRVISKLCNSYGITNLS